MRDPFKSPHRKRRLTAAEVDARLDAFLQRVRAGLGRRYRIAADFTARFRPRGLRRVMSELAGDALTFGLGGLMLMLALALPAFDATESDWRNQADFSATFLDRYGNEIGKRGIRHSDAVPLDEMPDSLIKAVLATEDRRFFEHFGIDVLGTARAMLTNLRANAVVQGGSSLTQQLAKNLFLSNERTIERKIKEAFLALWLEANLSKTEILKLYLDRAYMGGGNFGVEAASEFYFGKSVKEVSLAESAMLAGLFKAPTRYAPHLNLPAARARANEVLNNLVEAGLMSEGQVLGARRHPAEVVERATSGSPDYFLDWAFTQLKIQDPKGDRVLTIKTTIDMNLQKAAEDAIESSLRQMGDQYRVHEGALVAMDPDGAVRAMVGGRDYGASQFNRATDALRQPGSSFKPFVYTTALINGYTPNTTVLDAPITIGDWSPKNYGGGYMGSITLTTALVNSLNTVAVRLAQAFGRDKIVDLAHKMGVNSELKITRSLPLGTSEVNPLEMASAYAVFANGGYKAPPYAYTQITNSQGDVVYDRKKDAPPRVKVLEDRIVAEINSMLVQVPERGTGRGAKLDGIRTGGKTGTTNSYRDAWFDGFTGNYVASVWFGNDNFQAMRLMTGGTLPAQTWKKFMSYAHTGIELKPIPFIEPERPVAVATTAPTQGTPPPAPTGPLTLSVKAGDQLMALEKLLRNAPPLKTGGEEAAASSPVGFAQAGQGATTR